MIVYVEAVLLDNFCFDFLLGYLTYILTKQKPRYLPILLSAFVGCIFALLFPLFRTLGTVIKIPMLFVCSLLLTMKRSLRLYFINTLVYGVLTFLLSGIISFFLGGEGNGFIGVKWGGVIAATSGGILLLFYIVRQIVGLIKERKARGKYATAELFNGECSVKMNAIFDSGNLLKDQNGAGVAVTDKRYVRELGVLLSCGEMQVFTASGSKILKLVKIPEIRIYSEQGENILTNVTVALSELPKEYALILPCE